MTIQTKSGNVALFGQKTLTTLCHEEPEVLGVLEARLQEHDLLLVRVLTLVLCVHLLDGCVALQELDSLFNSNLCRRGHF
jgi:hypothetical protein